MCRRRSNGGSGKERQFLFIPAEACLHKCCYVGAKTEAESYRRIAASAGYEATQFLFLSDAGKEIEAARAAGMQALLCRREDTSGAEEGAVHAVYSFNDIFPE